MAMVLVRYAEEKTGLTWFSISRTLDDITAGLLEAKSSMLWYAFQISDDNEAKELFSKVSLKVPGKVLEAEQKVLYKLISV